MNLADALQYFWGAHIVREQSPFGDTFSRMDNVLNLWRVCAQQVGRLAQILVFCIVEIDTTIRIALYDLVLPVSRRFLVCTNLELHLQRQVISFNNGGGIVPSWHGNSCAAPSQTHTLRYCSIYFQLFVSQGFWEGRVRLDLVPIRHRRDVVHERKIGAIVPPAERLDSYTQVALEPHRIGDEPTV